VEFEGTSLTYRQLHQRSNRLARVLQKCRVGSEVRVGLYVERSLEMAVALLGILKAGGAYRGSRGRERSCSAQGMLCEWKGSGGLRVKQAALSSAAASKDCLDPEVRRSLLSMFEPEDLPRHVYYGEGSTIEDNVDYEKYAVRFQWRWGDVITLDNMLTAHGRDPYLGPRKIVVALGNMTNSVACL